jgi:hypothetical protein
MTAIKKENKVAPIVSRGFRGRRAADVDPARVPPGQYVTQDLPVTPGHSPLQPWSTLVTIEILPATLSFPAVASVDRALT